MQRRRVQRWRVQRRRTGRWGRVLRWVRSLGWGRLGAGLLLTTALLAFTAGCDSNTRVSQANGTKPTESPVPSFAVQNPRDVGEVAERPCELLRPEQAAQFEIDRPPRELLGVFGTVDCEWRSSRGHVWVYISVYIDHRTLEQVYSRRDTLLYFEVTETGGYPALVSRTRGDVPACDVDVKLAERQSVTVSYDNTTFDARSQQGCVVGKQVAQAVLENIPLAD